MFLLALHIVAIGIMVVIVWAIAHRRGIKAGERRLRRRLGLAAEMDEGSATNGAAGEAGDGTGTIENSGS